MKRVMENSVVCGHGGRYSDAGEWRTSTTALAVRTSVFLLLAAVGGALAAPPSTMVYVASYGKDSASCGRSSDPCASIASAVEVANPGDTIEVGPGRYAGATLDKQVTLVSRDGRDQTLVQSTGVASGELPPTISVTANAVQVGSAGHGFTILPAVPPPFPGVFPSRYALDVAPNLTGVRIVENHFIGNGVHVGGGTGHVISDNSFSDYAYAERVPSLGYEAILVEGSSHQVLNNVLSVGCYRDFAPSGTAVGIRLQGTSHTVRGNSVMFTLDQCSFLGVGISISGGQHTIEANYVSMKGGYGIAGGGTGSSPQIVNIVGNTVTGAFNGISLTYATGRVESNNIYGNETCGLYNYSSTIQATNNFWGAATGPGDPGDNVCNESGGTTIVSPWATAEIRPKGGKGK